MCEYLQHLRVCSVTTRNISGSREQIREDKVPSAGVLICTRVRLQHSQAGAPACTASQMAGQSSGQGQRGLTSWLKPQSNLSLPSIVALQPAAPLPVSAGIYPCGGPEHRRCWCEQPASAALHKGSWWRGWLWPGLHRGTQPITYRAMGAVVVAHGWRRKVDSPWHGAGSAEWRGYVAPHNISASARVQYGCRLGALQAVSQLWWLRVGTSLHRQPGCRGYVLRWRKRNHLVRAVLSVTAGVP